jgi:glycosyltransferase involved in cell wall biosynthesis
MPRFLRRAAAIIAVSENTRRDVTRLMGIPAEKIVVIHEGVNPAYHGAIAAGEVARVRQKYHLPARYLLFLGTLEPRKNIGVLLEAYHALLARDDSVPRLVVAGRKGWLFEPVFQKVEALGLGERVSFTDWVPEADTPALVAGAEVFVYPSLYEGFGLPPLEAMACGTPVITSTASSLPEVVGDGGLLVDPHDAAGLAQALERLLADDALRADLRGRALARARQFTWEAAARQTLAVYAQVLSAEPNRRANPV